MCEEYQIKLHFNNVFHLQLLIPYRSERVNTYHQDAICSVPLNV